MNQKSFINNRINSNIWKYYVFTFLSEFVVFLPFIIYYFQDLGFSLGQIAILQSFAAITVFLLEVPSGYIADKIGRKNSLLFGVICEFLAVILLFNSHNFTMLIISHILKGFAWAFISGADSALIYDSLLYLKKEKDYKKIAGKARFFGELSLIISAALGSLIIVYGIQNTILLTMIGNVMLIFVTFSFTEPPREILKKHKIHIEISKLFDILKRTLNNKKLFFLFLYSVIILGILDTIFFMYQPYFRATGLPLHYYGYVFATFSVFAAITSLKAHYIEKKLGMFWSLLIMPLFLVISLIGGSLVFMWAGFMLFFFRELVRGYIHPVIGDYTNKLVKSCERATVLSIGSMFARVGSIFILVIFGYSSDEFGLRIMLMLTGIILLIFTILVLIIIRREK